jgi:hypothetical protein
LKQKIDKNEPTEKEHAMENFYVCGDLRFGKIVHQKAARDGSKSELLGQDLPMQPRTVSSFRKKQSSHWDHTCTATGTTARGRIGEYLNVE